MTRRHGPEQPVTAAPVLSVTDDQRPPATAPVNRRAYRGRYVKDPAAGDPAAGDPDEARRDRRQRNTTRWPSSPEYPGAEPAPRPPGG